MFRVHSLLVAPALLCTSGALFGQELLREHDTGFGVRVEGIRDVDGDAVGDYSLRLNDSGGDHVQVVSGSSGARLFTIDGTQPSAYDFGLALADAGDVDADGVTDLLIGAADYVDPAQSFVWPGAVYVHSGRDGKLLWTMYGGADNDSLGFAVSGLDDVDFDGFADFLAGATQSYPTGGGYVRCYSGKSGTVLYQVDGTSVGDGFGAVSALSDHDHDGIRDFAVSAKSYTRICSGADGSTIATIQCPTSNTFWAQCEIDDLDGDGEPEIAIGEADPIGADGEVRVVSIRTQTQLRLHSGAEPNGRFGSQMSSVADADGDGVRDYLIGAPGMFGGTRGSALLFSGRTGERLYLFVDPRSYYLMAYSVADAGDLDGDGRSELLIGSPYHDDHTQPDFGATFVFRGNDLWLDADLKFPVAGSVDTLATHGAPPGNPVALFMVDVNGTPTVQLLALGAADGAEAFRATGTVPSGLAGTTLTFRSYAIGSSGSVAVSADETIYFQ